MKKLFTLFVATLAVMSLSAKKIYLVTNSDWNSYGAVFFVHSWGGEADADVKLALEEGEEFVFSAEIPDDNNNLLFVRAQGDSESIPWGTEDLWTQTGDLTLPEDADHYWLIGWTEGVWKAEGERPTVALVGNYAEDMWGANETNTMVPADDKASAAVKLNLAAGEYEIKVWVEGFYLSLNGETVDEQVTKYRIHRDWNKADNVNLVNNGENFVLAADEEGSYLFTWSYAERNLVVTFPAPTPTEIITTDAAQKVLKRIVNGQLIIEKNGVYVNALGQPMR